MRAVSTVKKSVVAFATLLGLGLAAVLLGSMSRSVLSTATAEQSPPKHLFVVTASQSYPGADEIHLYLVNRSSKTLDRLAGDIQIATPFRKETVPYMFQYVDSGDVGEATVLISPRHELVTSAVIRSVDLCQVGGKYYTDCQKVMSAGKPSGSFPVDLSVPAQD